MPTSENGLTFLDFDESVQDNLNDLKLKYEKYFPSKSFSSDISDSSIFRHDLNDSFVSILIKEFLKFPIDNQSTPFILSFYYSKLAITYKNSGDLDKAWFLLSRAFFFAGIANATLFGARRFKYEVVNAHSIKGAASRSSNITAAKNRAAELIREVAAKHMTDSKEVWPGWKARVEAADAIVDAMRAFLRTNGIGLKPEGISKRVYEWMSTDEGIRSAFNETCAKGSTYTPQKRRDWDGC